MGKHKANIKLYIAPLNGHRAGEFIATALRIGFMTCFSDIEIVYNRMDATHTIMYATLVNNEQARANVELMQAIPSLLLHDDLDIPSEYTNVEVVSAFTTNFMPCIYFHPLYQSPMVQGKLEYDFVYGGTFKPSRLENYKATVPDAASTLIIGDDERWTETFPNSSRMATIRDMTVLYWVMSKCRTTAIVTDDRELHSNKVPLRAIEPYLCGMTLQQPIAYNDARALLTYLRDILCKQL